MAMPTENYVFFLQLEEKLPTFYLTLARIMNKLNISLVPVTPTDLKEMKAGPAIYVLSIVSSFSEYQKFLTARKQFLDFSLMNRKFCLFDINSFEQVKDGEKFLRNKNYYYYPLPITPQEICANLALTYLKERGDITIWPGGKRSKLPAALMASN